MALSSCPSILSRRNFLIASGAALSGCSYFPSMKLVGEGLSQSVSPSTAYPRTRGQVDALSYAQLGIRMGSKGERGIMVLAERSGERLQWVSANRVMIATRNGRLVRTVGLQADLANTQLFGPDLLDHYDVESPGVPDNTLLRIVDVGTSFGVSIRSRFTIEGSETITILDQPVDTLRIREDLNSDVWRWRASNYYWVSKRSALAWRSRQHLGPDLPWVELEVLKRPG